ncbi:polyunsaturated fatty acid lipoxygenase ALOX15B-like, partial [Malurus melanocephalus]|uniref:polyunsaturated fatty acid lipoxygenase ALOX15B-like n=1 Tax=Malurus melanocephalus TaxID=175006 RepID=UPI0025480E09
SGVNPVLLRRCPRLPPNFPLSNATVAASLGPGTSLDTEMQVRDPKIPKKHCHCHCHCPQATSVGRRGTLALVARATLSLRYHELCVPEDVAERGVGDIPGYHYRDDALDIWTALQSYVQGVVALFYGGDSDVAEDEELQEWVGEIFTYGVLGNADTGRGHRLLLAELRTRLGAISQRIRRRNAELELPYPYLDPAVVQESISI